MAIELTMVSTSAAVLAATNIFYFLLVPTIILWFVYWKISRRHMIALGNNIPGPKGYPIIGNLLDVSGSPARVFQRLIEKADEYERIGKLWIGPRLVIFLFDPRDVEVILSSHVHLNKAPEYDYFKPWFGDGLLLSTGHKWRSDRKLIVPTFHLNVLKTFIDLFNENSREVVKKMEKEIGKTFDAHDYMSEATVEILLETVMGVSKKTQDSGYDYAMAVMKMCDILHVRHRSLILQSNFLFNLSKYAKEQMKLLGIIHGLTKKVIRDKKAAFVQGTRGSLAQTEIKTVEANLVQNNLPTVDGLSFGQSAGLKDDLDVDIEEKNVGQKKRLAFLDLLLESAQNGAMISDKEIKEQVDTIMFEGHDTTAAGSSFFLSIMGIHQDIQQKVYEELHSIFGDSDRPVTFEDTLQMKYLERCLFETLRMFPPVPTIARTLTEDVRLPESNYILPAGATISIVTYLIHRNPNIYQNPDKFNPDNFLPEQQANRHFYAFIPFSAGPRSCVGRKYAVLKLKILLATILRNYRVYSDMKENDFKLQADIILKREEGFQIRVEPRDLLKLKKS